MTNLPDDAMDPSQHPEDSTIQDYLKTPEAAAFDGLRVHLASCGYCRRRAELTALLQTRGEWLENERCEADPRLADLLAGRLDRAQAQQLRAQLQQDPVRLRAALHYLSHAQAMSEIDPAAGAPQTRRSGPLATIRNWLSFEAPLWQTVPVMALVMGLALLLLQQAPLRPDADARIVAFDDTPRLQFVSQQSQPGIGFFSQPDSAAESFDGMRIELLDERRLRMSWPAIEAANGYNLKLQVFRDGETRVLARQKLQANSTELQLDEALTQHRYEWLLSGDTRDQRSFRARGGFVVTRD